MFGLKTTKYLNNPDLAEKIFELLPYQPYVNDCKDKDVKKVCCDCKNVQDSLNKVIEVCGPPNTPQSRYIYAITYAWSKVEYNDKAIHYLKEYLSNELYDGAYINGNPKISCKKRKNIHISNMLNYLGKAYEKKYDFENALNCHLKRIELEPEFEGVYIDVSNIYVKMNKLEIALDFLEKTKSLPFYKDSFKNTIEIHIDDIKQKIKKGYVYKPRKKK